MEENILNAISSIGVPAGISFYLLIKINSTLERLTEVIQKINTKIDMISNR